MILSGTELASRIRGDIAVSCALFEKRFSRRPCLAVVLAGSNPASASYVRGKEKACSEAGIDHVNAFFDDSVTQEALVECVRNFDKNPDIDGILVQLPLPSHVDSFEVLKNISAFKDVDGFTCSSMGALMLGRPCLVPCTPKGILRILDNYGISAAGKNVCIIGRSNIVGKPSAALFMMRERNATVTVCHSKTQDLFHHVKGADIVVCAVGKPGLVTGAMIKPGAVVIDVGINRVPDSTKKKGYRIIGDADYSSVSEIASAISPVPGGVGPMTVAMLLENTFMAACMQRACSPSDFGYSL